MRRLHGFAILSAIFILVVLAALGAFILNVSTNQQIGSALDVQGVRAYQAARAGIEWGLYQVESTGANLPGPEPGAYNFSYGNPATAVGAANPDLRRCPGTALSPTLPQPSTSSFAPSAPTLAGFTVTVTCTPTVDANDGPTVYSLTATACNQPLAGACPNEVNPTGLYVERQLTVIF